MQAIILNSDILHHEYKHKLPAEDICIKLDLFSYEELATYPIYRFYHQVGFVFI